ncbi:amidohydrolase family protein [Paramicrobacterium chengjingii]|uniref:Amidohydrolase family protein n=1 Tax=Paramicrobacterium chengjingii TaxID=2769067 RepID=A0ABX6YHE6_9MICO|nr:amidohydrolase family protein [Microbacterium chengjingii]QPZ38229.1 amidohydrolase family protein [Microbacterium chengjingii]
MPEPSNPTDAAAATDFAPGVAYGGPIIDAHHHVWDLDENLYPWLMPSGNVPHRYGDYSAIKKNYLASDYLRDISDVGVTSSVYMEAEWDPTDALGEVRYIAGVAKETGVPGAMAAQAWLDADDVESTLEALSEFDIVRSVRHKPGGPATRADAVAGNQTLMSNPTWRRGYELLGRFGLHFELQTPWWNLPEACALADTYPATTLIINHSGVLLDREPETIRAWSEAMAQAAVCPNVFVKASGLCVEGKPWTVDLNRDIVLSIIELFGAERVMFGSNFPVDGMFTTYRELVDGYTQITRGLSASEKRDFFFGTAQKLYAPIA